jgi:hypothetical protein
MSEINDSGGALVGSLPPRAVMPMEKVYEVNQELRHVIRHLGIAITSGEKQQSLNEDIALALAHAALAVSMLP